MTSTLGPGVDAEAGAMGTSPTYTYTFQKGLIVQGGISGSIGTFVKEANDAFYGVEKSPTEIVLTPGAVTVPEGTKTLEELYSKLDELSEYSSTAPAPAEYSA